MSKIKVIQIAHASHSYFANENDDLMKIVLNDWYFKFAKQLKKFYPEIDVECWAPEKKDKNYSETEIDKIKIKFFPVKFSPMYALDYSPELIKKLKEEVKKSKEEGYKLVIHLHEIHNLHGLIISKIFKKEKIIAQHHGGSSPLKHLKQTKKYKLFFAFFFLGQILENLFLKNIKIFYVLSNDEINYIKKTAPKSKVRFQTMGIEEDYFKKIEKKMARKKLNIPISEKMIIFVGRVSKLKGLDFLIKAMKDMQEIKLYILGYGEERKELEEISKDYNIKNVEFLGGIFGKKKLWYLSAADALVLPSTKEGAPVVVMEALSRNTPVVVTDVGGIRTMIEDGREGKIIRQKDSADIVRGIQEVLTWKNKDVRKYAEKYRWGKIIEDTVKDYEKI